MINGVTATGSESVTLAGCGAMLFPDGRKCPLRFRLLQSRQDAFPKGV